MKLIITIDTEEDHWARYRTIENRVENIECLTSLQELFDHYKVKPTYLISYPVATNPKSVATLKPILDQGKCEIGSHCHPWNTPPFEEEINEHNSMLCNLPEELQFQKLKNLHDVITQNFGVEPVSFRAGRWGFNTTVARSLALLGYRAESSVTPYCDWSAYRGPDFSGYDPQPFRFNSNNLSPQPEGSLLQIPASIGFLQGNFQNCHRLSQQFESCFFKKIHFKSILHHLGLLNKIWLSPEHADAVTMIKFAKRMMKNNYPCLNMTFHSPSLMAGLSPFVTSEQDLDRFLQGIDDFLKFASDSGLESMTLAQYESCT